MPATANASIVLRNSYTLPMFPMHVARFLKGHTFWKMLPCLALAGSTHQRGPAEFKVSWVAVQVLKKSIQNGCMMDKTASFILVT